MGQKKSSANRAIMPGLKLSSAGHDGANFSVQLLRSIDRAGRFWRSNLCVLLSQSATFDGDKSRALQVFALKTPLQPVAIRSQIPELSQDDRSQESHSKPQTGISAL